MEMGQVKKVQPTNGIKKRYLFVSLGAKKKKKKKVEDD